MPKHAETHRLAPGKSIVRYSSGSSAGGYFYREYTGGKYITRKIENAADMNEAISLVFDVARSITPSSQSPRRTQTSTNRVKGVKRELITDAVRNHINQEYKRSEANLITENTFKATERKLRLHLLPYLESKGIVYTNQIDNNTFSDYLIYRKDTTQQVRSSEIKGIKYFLVHYLIKNDLMDSKILLDRSFLPVVVIKQKHLDANPPMSPQDWRTTITYVRKWRGDMEHHINQRYYYWRTLMWHWLLVAKNSGMSSEEVHKLQWKQIKFIDEKRITSDDKEDYWEVAHITTQRAKTGNTRTVPCNLARELRRWKEFQDAFIKKHHLNIEITPHTTVFCNLWNDLKPYHHNNIGRSWREIMAAVKDQLEGCVHTSKNFTLHSLRATYVTDQLRAGVPIYTVAQAVDHSVSMAERVYSRMQVIDHADRLAIPKLGIKGKKKKTERSIFDPS